MKWYSELAGWLFLLVCGLVAIFVHPVAGGGLLVAGAIGSGFLRKWI